MATSYHNLLHCNSTTKEDDSTLPSSSSFQTQKRQNTQENNPKKIKRREGAYLQAFVLPSHFWLPLLPFYFKHFLLASSSSQAKKKKKKTKKKKCRKRKALSFKLPLYPLNFGSCFSLPTFALMFQMFSYSIFFFSNIMGKKMHKREGAFLEALTLPFHFWLPLLPSHSCRSISNIFS
jgi:hypothetical protein